MDERKNMYHELALLADSMKSSSVTIELEARMIIPQIKKFVPTEERTITYYKCSKHPTLNIRRPNFDSKIIETKELIEKRSNKNVTVALSVEQIYPIYSFKGNLILTNSRNIRRKRIQENPNIDITEENGIFTVEIEFNIDTWHLVQSLIEGYKIPYWPASKPKETHASEILGAIVGSDGGWCISPKADGIHVLLYCNKKNVAVIDDTGKIIFLDCASRARTTGRYPLHSLSENAECHPHYPTRGRIVCPCSLNKEQRMRDNEESNLTEGLISAEEEQLNLADCDAIYEAEMMENEILVFDCLMHNRESVSNLDYKRRLHLMLPNSSLFDGDRQLTIKIKPIYEFYNFDELNEAIKKAEKSLIKSDGLIINSLGPKSDNVFKSKSEPTVDLLYLKGNLYLASESISDRVSNDPNYEYQENMIYEFTLDLMPIKIRSDKLIPNYKMPPEINPIAKIASASGIPNLRYYHNRIKFELLSKLPRTTLLDIGSGKGGDIQKWAQLKFAKVYAVDPDLELRNNPKFVVPIKDYVQNIPDINFDSVSLLFVPWHDEFLNVIQKASNFVIAAMDSPCNYSCDAFKCEVLNNEVKLYIPDTQTAVNIKENVINISIITRILVEQGWSFKKEEFAPISFASEHEKVLSKMYSFYFFTKKF
jgi:hypothetical protein